MFNFIFPRINIENEICVLIHDMKALFGDISKLRKKNIRHIIMEVNGGQLKLDNLKPLCNSLRNMIYKFYFIKN